MSFRAKALHLLAQEGRAALVTLARVEGSSPREKGTQMLVTSSGFIGSIGGGTLEWQALAEAQKLLRAPDATTSLRTYSLGPDLGQCCGGRVRVETRLITSAEHLNESLTSETTPRPVILYGAGHVGKSLVLLLAQAPFAVTWVDPRAQAFPAVHPANVILVNDSDVISPISTASDGALVVVMSHSHELDFAVTDAALRDPAIAHVLLIGSETKRARFVSRLVSAGHDAASLARLICPIGDGVISGKTPYAVALSTAHQLVALDEQLSQAQRDEELGREQQAG
jgi:xanthine dehydrogenase accessory factor